MNVEAFLSTLPMMLKGMVSIFAVMVVIGLMIVGLNKFSASRGNKKKD